MTEVPPAEQVVATITSCDQYRFQVNFPASLGREFQAEIRRRALEQINGIFLECTRRFQSVAWRGATNLSFADARPSPSDSKSEFLHLLICLKSVELAVSYGGGRGGVVVVETVLRHEARKGLEKLARDLGLTLRVTAVRLGFTIRKARVGGRYRSARQSAKPFMLFPVKRMEDLRASLGRRLASHPFWHQVVDRVLLAAALPFWPLPILARMVFTVFYRSSAMALLNQLDGARNVFVYFDMRLGQNRDVGAYLKWKYFQSLPVGGASCIPFTHVARPCNGYSVPAMWWAMGELRKMARNPLEGCVVASYLIPPLELCRLFWQRMKLTREMREGLLGIIRQEEDPVAVKIYREFLAAQGRTRGFPLEISAAYSALFEQLAPGVVIQADAVAKTARHFTASARQRGGRVIYVADRICTALRTSNQLVDDGGENLHFPDRCVVFDQVTRDEFIRQGMAAWHVHVYRRHFGEEAHVGSSSVRDEVLILLQAYEDNIGAMIRLGEEIVRRMPMLRVVYQEHPNFPVSESERSRLLADGGGRLRFLEKGGKPDYGRLVSLVTGYSTASAPGVIHGVPLIWLRREIDNSIFCESFLDRIGFAADDSNEVVSLLELLSALDKPTQRACESATRAAWEIFLPAGDGSATGFAAVLGRAVDESFAEISGDPARSAVASPAATSQRSVPAVPCDRITHTGNS